MPYLKVILAGPLHIPPTPRHETFKELAENPATPFKPWIVLVEEVEYLQVGDLKPFLGNISLKVKIIELPPPREVAGGRHKVSEALVGDESGCIYLTLWDDHTLKFEKGNTIQLEKGYVSVHRQSMRLTNGKYGTITKIDEEIPEANTDNNLSDQLVKQKMRKTPRGSNTSDSSNQEARMPKKRRYWHQRR